MQTIKTFDAVEKGNRRLSNWKEQVNIDDFESKVIKTTEYIRDCLNLASNPIILCSFGKDSLVLLDLVHKVKKTPVIYWREPFFQKKFSFPQQMAEKLNLAIYDYPPLLADYIQIEDYFEIFNFYQLNGMLMNLYTGCKKYEDGKEYLCAIRDLINRPKCTGYDFQWDVVFHGHKQSDPIYIEDRIQLNKTTFTGTGLLCLPIIDWSDAEIWAYIETRGLDYNKERYDSGVEENNNDLYPTCFDCLDYRNKDKKIMCKKFNKEVCFCGKSEEQNKELKEFILKESYKQV